MLAKEIPPGEREMAVAANFRNRTLWTTVTPNRLPPLPPLCYYAQLRNAGGGLLDFWRNATIKPFVYI